MNEIENERKIFALGKRVDLINEQITEIIDKLFELKCLISHNEKEDINNKINK